MARSAPVAACCAVLSTFRPSHPVPFLLLLGRRTLCRSLIFPLTGTVTGTCNLLYTGEYCDGRATGRHVLVLVRPYSSVTTVL